MHTRKVAKSTITLLAASLLLGPLSMQAAPAATVININPQPVAPSTAAPGRGYSDFYETNGAGVGDYYDYRRFTWRAVEPSENQYNLALIESYVQQAAAQGKKFSFGIMPLLYNFNNQNDVGAPDYIINSLQKGFYFTKPGGGSCYVPDWNDPIYIQRTAALAQAVAAKYDGDPRIGWIDIRSYGTWGEWHIGEIPYNRTLPPGPNWMTSVSGAKDASIATKQALVDAYVDAFHTTQLVINAQETEGLSYALNKLPTIGIRRDGLGQAEFHSFGSTAASLGDITNTSPLTIGQIIQGHWQSGPFIAEFFGDTTDSIPMAIQDVQGQHVSIVESNIYPTTNPVQKQNEITLGQTAGYNYLIQQAQTLSDVQASTPLPVNLLWTNTGVSPVYSNWNIQVQLRSHATGAVINTVMAKTQLNALQPNSPVWEQVQIPTPASVTNALAADVVVKITDPLNYFPPLPLSIQGRQSDGSYLLTSVVITPYTNGQEPALPAPPSPPPSTPPDSPQQPGNGQPSDGVGTSPSAPSTPEQPSGSY